MSDTIWASLIALFGTGGFAGLFYRLHRDSLKAFRTEMTAERQLHLKVVGKLAAGFERGHAKVLEALRRLDLSDNGREER